MNHTRRSRVSLALVTVGLAAITGCAGLSHNGARPMAAGSERATPAWMPQWMIDAPYAPTFRVLDTESSLGPYATQTKRVTLEDLVLMHGHPCDGLVTAACALKQGLAVLYPDGVIDRTDTGCITNNSPCFGDVASYLTGGRIRFGTQKIDPRLKNEFILYRFSTGRAVEVSLKPEVFPPEVAELEARVRSGKFNERDMRRCQRLEWAYARHLMQHPLDESFTVQELKGFTWRPDAYAEQGKRGDVVNKNYYKHNPSTKEGHAR